MYKYAACRKVLEPYAEDVHKSEDDINNEWGYAPMERDVYKETLSAARIRLELCQKAEQVRTRRRK